MIDVGHIILMIIAILFGVFAWRGNKRAKLAEDKVSSLNYNNLVEEVKRESINQTNDERLRKFNAKYGQSSGNH